MKWLALAWAISAGFIPNQNDSLITDAYRYGIEHENALVVNLELDATVLDYFHVYGGVKTYATPSEWAVPFLAPYRADYTAGIFWRFGQFDIGIDHECDHGVLSGPASEPWYGMGQTEFFIRFSSRRDP